MVESRLPKPFAAGSIPDSRSKINPTLFTPGQFLENQSHRGSAHALLYSIL